MKRLEVLIFLELTLLMGGFFCVRAGDVEKVLCTPLSEGVKISYRVSPHLSEKGKFISVRVSSREGAPFEQATAFEREPVVKSGEGELVWYPDKDGFSGDPLRAVYRLDLVEEDPLLYLVIDLSSGPLATRYPVSYLSACPAGGWSDKYRTTRLVLRRVPAGSFMMGSPVGEPKRHHNEGLHRVTLTRDFYIGVFELTQRQWELVMGKNPLAGTPEAGACRAIQRVTYNEIRGISAGSRWPASREVDPQSFIGRIRARTGIDSFDLPTEAQWEYACRAGTRTTLNSGKNLTSPGACPNMAEVGRYRYNQRDGKGGYSDLAKVGCYRPNSWGLYDMHGNAWEWCIDWYSPNLGDKPVVDPLGPESGPGRSVRGGSYFYPAWVSRAAIRGNSPVDGGHSVTGFRLGKHPFQIGNDRKER